MKTILILGASSDIAKAAALRFAQEKFNVILAGRDIQNLKIEAKDLSIRHSVEVKAAEFDALKFKSHSAFYSALKISPDVVLCAVGILGDQTRSEENFDHAKLIIDTNYTGCVSILNIIAEDFKNKKSGTIIGISSVAGDRGRQSNYTYGSAKAAFSSYLSGLRNRLYKSGVHVITVKPGFVRTRMTEGMKLPGLLTADPSQAAGDIYRAWKKGKNEIYTRWFWKYIMRIIIHIPEGIFKKLNL
ncbi:MAG: SDR family oxidoreductase [Spirochaetia bacterium]|nr:SDR family oxidoreductase [Spirochaetia bacterium]